MNVKRTLKELVQSIDNELKDCEIIKSFLKDFFEKSGYTLVVDRDQHQHLSLQDQMYGDEIIVYYLENKETGFSMKIDEEEYLVLKQFPLDIILKI